MAKKVPWNVFVRTVIFYNEVKDSMHLPIAFNHCVNRNSFEANSVQLGMFYLGDKLILR